MAERVFAGKLQRAGFADVWVAAAGATLFLKGTESLFGLYLREFATLNVFPEPVTPSSTWCLAPFRMPSVICLIACG